MTEPILSREEVERLWHNSNNDGTLSSQLMSFSAALESALLEKMCGEPVAEIIHVGDIPNILGRANLHQFKNGTCLYALNRSKA